MTPENKLAYNLFNAMKQGSLKYIYRGHFSRSITEDILNLTETNLERTIAKSQIRKRIYFIMVECLQNIVRHQDAELNEIINQPGIFAIQRKDADYYITTGNIIQVENINPLKSQIEKINSFEETELKEYYLEILREGKISEKGGAGLGLVEMARKSGNKLSYNFTSINKQYSYFYLHTQIPCKKTEVKTTSNLESTLEDIKNLHAVLNKNNILISFCGNFNQESLISLLSMLEGQMLDNTSLKIKLFNIMVELLQNIVKHASQIVTTEDEPDEIPGIFFLCQNEDYFILNTGNFIEAKTVGKFKANLEYVNQLTFDELDNHYNRILLDFEIDDPKRSGLGLYDIRLKSGQQYQYDFQTVDDKYVFYSFRAEIPLKKIKIEPLILEPTDDCPSVYLDPENEIFTISKRSMPEDAVGFYSLIINWLRQYKYAPNANTVFNFKLEYLNTSSIKQITKVLLILDDISHVSNITIYWYYKKIDSDMLSVGLRLSKMFSFKFNLVEY